MEQPTSEISLAADARSGSGSSTPPTLHVSDHAHPDHGRPRPAFVPELHVPINEETLVRPTPVHRSAASTFLSHVAHMVIGAPVWLWAAFDLLVAFWAVRWAHMTSPVYRPSAIVYHIGALASIHAVLFFLTAYTFGLYGRQIFDSTYQLLLRATAASTLAIAAATLWYTWVRFLTVGRWIVAFTLLFTVLGVLVVRLVAKGFAGLTKMRVLLVGNPEHYRRLSDEIVREYGNLYEPPVVLDVRNMPRDQQVARTLEMFGFMRANEVVVEDDSELLVDLLHASAPIVGRGGVLRTHSAFHEDLLHETPIDIVDCRSLLGQGWGIGRQSTEALKRGFDVLLSLFGLTLSSPLMLIAALLVRVTSRGPIIYKQTRVGRFGRNFSIYKFRTMQVDAEKDGPVWAAKGDDRTTSVGAFLRKSRLDELPQLWNILLGQMSFVGPRPERPEFIAALEREIPFYQLRHLVPPGLTGWAQIRYRYGASIADAKRKLAYDLYYVRRYGLTFDLAICLKTVVTMARGAR
ncbi:MAG: exopolysaccharide biosynthesis polyprenyl glycosylphosphotransferase [Acidobacteria bacterium]|nr:exopolysaccharide biosynthesis polyprenyl glycosylphosphotransferase [Acidobacteriota bacterium]